MTDPHRSQEPDSYQTVAGMAPGQVLLERYSLKKILGRGGFGVVWLAHDNELEMDVAIKFLSDLIVSNPEAIDDLKRETRFSLKLTHPSIVRIYGFIQGPTIAGINMEYIDGGSLAGLKLQQPHRCFDVETLGVLTEKLCDALHYAHTKVKIAHRDLKPGNLMVDSDGELKVADFGISRSISDTQTALTRLATSGTPAFMSPQQMMGKPARLTDDIYSLGATLYDLLAGKPPFYQGEVAEQVRHAEPASIAERRAELGIEAPPVPEVWEEAIRACLAKEPEARPQSAADVAERLGLRVSVTSQSVPIPGRADGDNGSPYSASGTAPANKIPTPPYYSELAGPDSRPVAGRSNPMKIWGPVLGLVVVAAIAFFVIQNRSAESPASAEIATGGVPGSPTSNNANDSRGGEVGDGASGSPDGAGVAGATSAGSESATPDPAEEEPSGSSARQESSSGSVGISNSEKETVVETANPRSELVLLVETATSEIERGAFDDAEAAIAKIRAIDSASGVANDLEADVERGRSIEASVRRVETAIGAGNWSLARTEYETLRRLDSKNRRIAGFESQILGAETVSNLRSGIPRKIDAGDLAAARADVEALLERVPNDPQATSWLSALDKATSKQAAADGRQKAILDLIDEFHFSMREIDIDRFTSLWTDPNKTRATYERAFSDMVVQEIDVLEEPRIDIQGAAAVARLTERRKQTMKVGGELESTLDLVFYLERQADLWKIVSIDMKMKR